MKYSYSIHGRTNEAIAFHDGEIWFNLNVIKKKHDKMTGINKNYEYYIDSLIAYLNAVELHELGHIYNWKHGCSKFNHIDADNCPWCNEVEKIYYWLQEVKK
jgi:hypothetical protein